MKKRLSVLLASAAAVATGGTAVAQDAELEARVLALEALVRELQAELARGQVEPDDGLVMLETRIEENADAITALRDSAPAGSPGASNGFQVGDTRVSVGGFVDVDAHVTSLSDGSFASSSIARDFYIPGATPVGDADSTTTTDFTAESTRVYVDARRTVGAAEVTGRVEVDFLGSLQGNERVSNSFSPRLRRAYVDVNGVRLGQDWSTFQNTSAIPESASFLALSDGMVFVRQPLARLTRGPIQVALENGDTTYTPVGGGRVEADANHIPDAVVRYNVSGERGNVSFAGLLRQLRAEMGGTDEDAFGWGLSVAGRVNVGERDDVRFSLSGGEGMGRYVGLNAANGAVVNPSTGELEAIGSVGALVAWRHPFGEDSRFNIGASGLVVDNPDYAPSSSTSEVYSGYIAVLTDIAPRTSIGGEILYGRRETEAGDEGDIFRMTVSSRFAF